MAVKRSETPDVMLDPVNFFPYSMQYYKEFRKKSKWERVLLIRSSVRYGCSAVENHDPLTPGPLFLLISPSKLCFMKWIPLTMMISLMLFWCAPAQESKAPGWEPERYYPFGKEWIDLESLEMVKPAGMNEHDFKTDAFYAFRFTAPRDWMDNYHRRASYHWVDFDLRDDGTLWITDKQTEESIKADELPAGASLDHVTGNDFLVPVTGGMIRVSRLDEENVYLVKKILIKGETAWSVSIPHTEVVIDGNTHTSYPWLYYADCTPEVMLFTSYDRSRPGTVSLNLKDGSLSRYPFTMAGFIRDEDEAQVPGFLIIDDEKQTLECKVINTAWTVPLPGNLWKRAEVLLSGQVLYVALYHPIATGSALMAFELTTGKMLWTAPVLQLNVSHSEYYNAIYLSAYGDKLILEGIEAEGHYVQIFDKNTGERLFSTF